MVCTLAKSDEAERRAVGKIDAPSVILTEQPRSGLYFRAVAAGTRLAWRHGLDD